MRFGEYCRMLGLEKLSDNQYRNKEKEIMEKMQKKDSSLVNFVKIFEKDYLNGKKGFAAYYDAVAPLYDAMYSNGLWYDGLIANAVDKEIQKSKSVLEVASGTGTISLYLAAKNPGKRFVCVDFSKGMVREAERKMRMLAESGVRLENIEFRIDDIDKYIPEKKFDSIYEVRGDVISDNGRDMSRLLADGGTYMRFLLHNRWIRTIEFDKRGEKKVTKNSSGWEAYYGKIKTPSCYSKHEIRPINPNGNSENLVIMTTYENKSS